MQVLVRRQSNWNPPLLLIEMRNSRNTSENSLTVIYEVTHILYNPLIPLLDLYPKEIKIMATQNSYSNVYSSFIDNCPKLESY